jgi:2-iminobutanoate/2-iminopropanoate deaminase
MMVTMQRIILCASFLVLAAGSASCWDSNASETTGRKVIFTPDAPRPIGPYSQGILIGSTLYCSGQIGIDPNTGELVEGGIEAETDQALKNLGAILQAANMDYQDVDMVTIFLKDLNGYSAMNQVYARYFDVAPPARQAVEVARIPADANVEISVVAIK